MILGRNLKVIIDGVQVAGAKSVKVTANLADMDINTQLPELSFGALLESRDNQIDTSTITFIECPQEGQ